MDLFFGSIFIKLHIAHSETQTNLENSIYKYLFDIYMRNKEFMNHCELFALFKFIINDPLINITPNNSAKFMPNETITK